MYFNKVKKFLILLGAAATISLVHFSGLKAQGSNDYLKQIAFNTLGILNNVNTLPATLQAIGNLVNAWISPDTSEATTTMQGTFTQLGNLMTTNKTTQASLQANLNNDLLNNDGNNVLNANNGAPNTANGMANQNTLWHANDLVYSTLLGTPYYPKDPRAAKNKSINPPYNYIKNASGLNIYHPLPWTMTGGSKQAKLRYHNYFNTVMSVESFGAYVLSHQYADGSQFDTLQTTLIKQATDPKNWFAKVASENIGFVLRQVLLYESQTFVLLTQMLQVQKQAVAAQAMTNALLIATNQMNENVMIANAQGTKPST